MVPCCGYPCQMLLLTGSVLELVGPTSVYCEWVRKQVRSAPAVDGANSSLRYICLVSVDLFKIIQELNTEKTKQENFTKKNKTGS